MQNQIKLNDIDHTHFWNIFFAVSYPNGYDENTDLSVSDILEDICTDEDMAWWDNFTGYYEGILAESDGYLEHPTTLILSYDTARNLAIQFHPGDIEYFINDKKIGCTGPHWRLQVLPYKKVEQLLTEENGEALFLLLLPLVLLAKAEVPSAKNKIRQLLPHYFAEEYCDQLAACIICGITEE